MNRKRIFLLADKAKFGVIDVRDIGKMGAKIMIDATRHINQSYELTCNEKVSFQEMVDKLSFGRDVKLYTLHQT